MLQAIASAMAAVLSAYPILGPVTLLGMYLVVGALLFAHLDRSRNGQRSKFNFFFCTHTV